jgi:hypothetical protein
MQLSGRQSGYCLQGLMLNDIDDLRFRGFFAAINGYGISGVNQGIQLFGVVTCNFTVKPVDGLFLCCAIHCEKIATQQTGVIDVFCLGEGNARKACAENDQ